MSSRRSGGEDGRGSGQAPGRVFGRLGARLLLPLLLLLPITGAVAQSTSSPSPLEEHRASVPSPLEEQVQEALATVPGLRELRVEVRQGVARLEGVALSEEVRLEAEQAVSQVPGVRRVDNRLEPPADLEQRIAPALRKLEDRWYDLVAYLPLIVVAIVVLLLFGALARWVGGMRLPFRRLSANRFVQDLTRQTLRAAVLLVGLLLALEILDATALVGAVLGTAGVVGIAVGFAFRDLVENSIASVLLSLRQPFEPNDLVSIDGLEGKVVRLTSRATVLMTLDGNHLRIPNAKVFKGVILNYTRNPLRRFDFGVGVGVDEDLLEAQSLGVEILAATAGVATDPPPSAVVDTLGDSSVTVRFYGWVDQRQASFAAVRGEAIRRVKTALEDAGIDLPEPIYRLRLEGQSTPPGIAGETAQPKARAKRERPPAESSARSSARPAAPAQAEPGATEAGDAIDRQIAEERSGGEQDLLDQEAPKE